MGESVGDSVKTLIGLFDGSAVGPTVGWVVGPGMGSRGLVVGPAVVLWLVTTGIVGSGVECWVGALVGVMVGLVVVGLDEGLSVVGLRLQGIMAIVSILSSSCRLSVGTGMNRCRTPFFKSWVTKN